MGTRNFKIFDSLEVIDASMLDHFFKKADKTSLFQTPHFHRFFSSQPNRKALFFSIADGDQILVTISTIIFSEPGIKSIFSSRAIIYGGPVIDTKNPLSSEALGILLTHLLDYLRTKAIYLETRNLNDYSDYRDVFNATGFKYQPYVNFHINISDMDKTLAAFGNDKRSQIKKALRIGADIKMAENSDEVTTLYHILEGLYRSKVKKPLPNLSFFLDLFLYFQLTNCGFVSLVIFDGEVIGGGFCLVYNDTVFDFYRCGLDERYKNLYPSTMAVYAGILLAQSQGVVTYDFMGAGQMHIPYGVRDFKARFGGELVEYGRFLSVLNPLLYHLGRFYIGIVRLLK